MRSTILSGLCARTGNGIANTQHMLRITCCGSRPRLSDNVFRTEHGMQITCFGQHLSTARSRSSSWSSAPSLPPRPSRSRCSTARLRQYRTSHSARKGTYQRSPVCQYRTSHSARVGR
eukprot:3462497-Rhodomonas_salina.1